MKTLVANRTQPASVTKKAGSYVYHPTGHIHQSQQEAMRKALRPDEVQTESDAEKIDSKLGQESGFHAQGYSVPLISNITHSSITPIQRSENEEPHEELQRQPEEEEEQVQTKLLQRQPEEEEEKTIQNKPLADQITPLVQRQEESPEEEGEEPIQTKLIQRQPENNEEEEPLQTMRIQRKIADLSATRPSRFGYVGPEVKKRQSDIGRILRSTGAQAKLSIGKPNDKYEQEADRVADQVMRMPDPQIRPKPT